MLTISFIRLSLHEKVRKGRPKAPSERRKLMEKAQNDAGNDANVESELV
jgi:hypothetical protein